MAARSALLRSDSGIVGAAFVVLLTASVAVGIDIYAENAPLKSAESSPQFTQSPAELAAAKLQREQQCLADAMYYEGRSEGSEGQKAIAEVILARTRSPHYPHTICGVVDEGVERGKSCQFTFRCDGSMKRPKERQAWERSRQLAARILAGAERLSGETGNAIAYHTTEVSPIWAGTMLKTAQIGRHVFYRFAPRNRVAVETTPRGGELLSTGEIVPVDALPVSDTQPTIVAGEQVGGT